jgi:putative FmdB family regulatory protein
VPTYEYRCKACGQDLEVVQSFTDDALTTCESCGGQLRKVFGNVGIAFKGSGFYKNDSRGKSSTTASGTDKGSDAAAASGDTGGDGGGSKTDSSSAPTSDGAKPSTADKPATPAKADKPAKAKTAT